MKYITLLFFFQFLCFLSSSQITFQKMFPFSDLPIFIEGINPCTDGGAIVATTYNNYSTPALIKMDSQGQVVWSKSLTNGLNSSAAENVIEIPSGGYYFLSRGLQSNPTNLIYSLSKIGVNGNVIWSKGFSIGNYNASFATNMYYDPGGGVIIAFKVSDKMCLLKTDNSGNIIWTKGITSDLQEPNHFGLDISCTDDGGYLATGLAGSYMFLVKLGINGQIQWSQKHTDTIRQPNCVINCGNGSNIVCGANFDLSMGMPQGFIMKISNSGIISWFKIFRPSDSSAYEFQRAIQLSNGNFLFSGVTNYYDSKAFLLLTDSLGNVISSKVFERNESKTINTFLKQMPNSGILFSFNTVNDSNIISISTPFIFHSIDTDFFWCDVNDFAVNEVLLTFNPTVLTTAFTLPGVSSVVNNAISSSWNITSVAYCTNTNIEFEDNLVSYNVYPNPTKDQLNITMPQAICNTNYNIAIYNSLGEKISEFEYNKGQSISVINYPKGIYIVSISSNGRTTAQKFIIY